jgi:hypothetical protein
MGSLEKYKGDSNREVIELFLVSEDGAVALNDIQKTLLDRWTYADELIRKHEMTRETIARLIKKKFSVSRVTAYQDIVNAENVFSSSTPLNKKYRIQLRIEFLEMKINELYGMCEMVPKDPESGIEISESEEDIFDRIGRIKNNQEYMHEAKELEKILQKYYSDYPAAIIPRSPKNIIYNMQFNSMPSPVLTTEQAIELDNKTLNIKPRE